MDPESQKAIEKEVECRSPTGSNVGDRGDPARSVPEVSTQPQQVLWAQMTEYFRQITRAVLQP